MRVFLSIILFSLISSTIFAQSDSDVKALCQQEVVDNEFENALLMINGQRVAVDIDIENESSMLINKVSVTIWTIETPNISLKLYNSGTNNLPENNPVASSTTTVLSVEDAVTVGDSQNPNVFKKYELELTNPILIKNETNVSKKFWLELVPGVNALWQITTKNVKGNACAIKKPNENNWSLAIDSGGIHEAIYKIEGECENLSLDNYSIKSEIEIIPNPANDFINLKGIDLHSVKDLIIHNISGQKVNVTLKGEQLNISKLNAGIYFISFIFDNKNYSLKFIKK